MATIISHSAEDTVRLGRLWGREAAPGWRIGLTGELGTGKTQLVKGIASGLGVPGIVTSPSFTLLHEYEGGRFPLSHLDLYRLNRPQEIVHAGLADCLEDYRAGVLVVEWIERWWNYARGPAYVRRQQRGWRLVRFEAGENDERRLSYEDFGD